MKKEKSFDEHIDKLIKSTQPNYGRGMRKLRGILDLNQKEMAIRLNMPPQQLSQLEKKETWTDEVLKRVSESLEIPVSGLDYLATEPDLLGFFITNNTQGDGGIIGQNNFHNTYHFGNVDKIEEILKRFDKMVAVWSQKVDDLENDLKNANAKK